MFHTLKQYLTSSNNSDIYPSHHDNWRKQKNHHLGNWLQDMTRPFSNAMPMYENEQRFFWNGGRNKKNKYYMDPYYDNQHSMMYNNDHKRLRNKSSHKSLSSFFRINRHDDHPQYYNSSEYSHQNSRRSSQSNNQHHSILNSNTNHTNANRRQRHNSLPSSMNRNGQQYNMNAGTRSMPFEQLGNTVMNGNAMSVPMMQQQYPYQHQHQHHQQQHNPYYQQQSTMYDEPLMSHHLNKQTYNNGHTIPHSNIQQHNNNGHVQQKERHRSLSNGQSMFTSYGQPGMYMDPNYYYQQQHSQYNHNYYPNNNRHSLKIFR